MTDTRNWIILIKVDTDAIKRNGALKKDGSAEHEPTIIVLTIDDFGELVNEETVHGVEIEGPVMIRQDDDNPGAVGSDGRGARVWLECQGVVKTTTIDHQPPA